MFHYCPYFNVCSSSSLTMANLYVLWMCLGISLGVVVGVASQNYCEIKMRIYDSCNSSRFEEFCVEEGLKVFSSELYTKDNCKTVILGLSFMATPDNNYTAPVIDALTSRCAFNIILLDNSNHTDVKTPLEYPIVVENIYKDSKRYATVIKSALDSGSLLPECIIGLGFSLGAQILGQICRQLKDQYKCGSILGIDPAGPGYFYDSKSLLAPIFPAEFQELSNDDACNVVTMHCNRGITGLGTSALNAHENIIVNGGYTQDNCTFAERPNLCSHVFCNNLAADAIRRPGECLASSSPNSTDIFNLTIPIQQTPYSCNNSQPETYYLRTSTEEPKCLGTAGLTNN